MKSKEGKSIAKFIVNDLVEKISETLYPLYDGIDGNNNVLYDELPLQEGDGDVSDLSKHNKVDSYDFDSLPLHEDGEDSGVGGKDQCKSDQEKDKNTNDDQSFLNSYYDAVDNDENKENDGDEESEPEYDDEMLETSMVVEEDNLEEIAKDNGESNEKSVKENPVFLKEGTSIPKVRIHTEDYKHLLTQITEKPRKHRGYLTFVQYPHITNHVQIIGNKEFSQRQEVMERSNRYAMLKIKREQNVSEESEMDEMIESSTHVDKKATSKDTFTKKKSESTKIDRNKTSGKDNDDSKKSEERKRKEEILKEKFCGKSSIDREISKIKERQSLIEKNDSQARKNVTNVKVKQEFIEESNINVAARNPSEEILEKADILLLKEEIKKKDIAINKFKVANKNLSENLSTLAQENETLREEKSKVSSFTKKDQTLDVLSVKVGKALESLQTRMDDEISNSYTTMINSIQENINSIIASTADNVKNVLNEDILKLKDCLLPTGTSVKDSINGKKNQIAMTKHQSNVRPGKNNIKEADEGKDRFFSSEDFMEEGLVKHGDPLSFESGINDKKKSFHAPSSVVNKRNVAEKNESNKSFENVAANSDPKNVSSLKNQKRQCKYCDTILETAGTVKHHTLLHVKEYLLPELPQTKPFECPICHQNLNSLQFLIRHYAFSHDTIYKYFDKEDLEGRTIVQKKLDLPIPKAPLGAIKDNLASKEKNKGPLITNVTSIKPTEFKKNSIKVEKNSPVATPMKHGRPSLATPQKNVVAGPTRSSPRKSKPASSKGSRDYTTCPLCRTKLSSQAKDKTLEYFDHITRNHFFVAIEQMVPKDSIICSLNDCKEQCESRFDLLMHIGVVHGISKFILDKVETVMENFGGISFEKYFCPLEFCDQSNKPCTIVQLSMHLTKDHFLTDICEEISKYKKWNNDDDNKTCALESCSMTFEKEKDMAYHYGVDHFGVWGLTRCAISSDSSKRVILSHSKIAQSYASAVDCRLVECILQQNSERCLQLSVSENWNTYHKAIIHENDRPSQTNTSVKPKIVNSKEVRTPVDRKRSRVEEDEISSNEDSSASDESSTDGEVTSNIQYQKAMDESKVSQRLSQSKYMKSRPTSNVPPRNSAVSSNVTPVRPTSNIPPRTTLESANTIASPGISKASIIQRMNTILNKQGANISMAGKSASANTGNNNVPPAKRNQNSLSKAGSKLDSLIQECDDMLK